MTETPCPSNPLGIKGCGEAGAIASPPAVINAITDALGHEDIAMPATPQAVWRAAHGARHGATITPARRRAEMTTWKDKVDVRLHLSPPASVRAGGHAPRQERGRQAPRRRPYAAADDEAAPGLADRRWSTSRSRGAHGHRAQGAAASRSAR